MAFTSDRNILNLKKKGHFEHEETRIDKYTLADELPAQLTELSLRPRSQDYTLVRLSEKDREPVIEFLARFFFRDEPLNIAVKLLETPDDRCLELEEYVAGSLPDGVSVAAVDQNGDYVGIMINGITKREEATYEDKSESCPNPKFKRILKVLSHLERESRIWDKLPKSCHTVLEMRLVSTHLDWRGRGLMKAMCAESERIAREINAGAMRIDTTSAFSANAAEGLKYKKVYSVRYSELPFAPQPDAPHYEAKVYIKELENQSL